MTLYSLIRRMAVASVSLSLSVSVLAQTPTQTWAPAPTCTNGLPTPAAMNGSYIDAFGANYAVQCAQDSTGFFYDGNEGTNGHGIYSCFLGCDNRPSCTAFMYTGTVTGANTGAGKCYYKYSAGTYYSNSTVYAAGNLISNGTPNKPCPYYNGTTYTDTNGNIYSVSCGFDLSGGAQIAGTYHSDGMASCMNTCDSTSGCTSFSYTYIGSEPPEGTTNTLGTCFLRSGTATFAAQANPSVAAAIRVGTTSVSSSSATGPATTSTSAAASATCTLAPSPSTPVCPSANATQFTDPCGVKYTVYCAGYDTTPGSVTQFTTNSITACMQACDGYSGCQAATLLGTTCYIKTAFTAVTTSSNSALIALVRYIPPNPNYAVPPQAPCANCSTGCGNALPAGITINAGSSVLVNINSPTDGLLRNYTIHIPQYYDPNHAAPLILGFHGNGDTAAGIEAQTGFSKSSLNPYGIAVYVNGYGKGYESNPSWAPGGTYSYVDDIGFIKNLITNLTQTYCIDTGRIFAVGHSNGGGFVNVMACDPVLSVKVAVFAGNSAAMYTNFTTGDPWTIEPVNTPVQPVCSSGRNTVPMIEFHGTSDTQIMYNGDTTHNGRILPALPHWATDWSIREGYGSTNYSTTPVSGVTMYQFGGNAGQGQLGIVTHYRINGWVHQWCGLTYGCPIDASPNIMDFYYRWSDPNRAPAYAPNVASVSSSSSSTATISSSSSVSSSSSSSSVFATTTTVTTTTSTTTSQSSSSSSSSSSVSSSSLSSSLSSSSSSLSSSSSSASSSSSSGSSSVSSSSSMSSSQATSSVSSTSSSRSSTVSSSTQSSATSSSSGIACPGSNGQSYTDAAGIQYIIGCSADTTNGNYDVYQGGDSGSINDCIALCSANWHTTTGNNCTAISWVGSTTGAGAGTCYFKSFTSESFTQADSSHIGVIRVFNYVPGSYNPGGSNVVTTTTTTQPSSTQSSSTSPSSSLSSSSINMQTTSSSTLNSMNMQTTSSSTSPSGSTTSVSSTSNSAAPVASCVNGPVTDSNGKSYTIQCNSDTSTGSTGSQQFNTGSYAQCMTACDAISGCSGWTWTPYELGGGICYFKTGQITYTTGMAGYVAGILAGNSAASTTSSMSSQMSSIFSQTSSMSSQMSGQSTASSTTTQSSSASASPSGVASCPGSNGQTVTDTAGVRYQISCSSDTSGGNYNVYNVQNGLNDCFAYCDNSQTLDSTRCTSWTFAGSVDGAGPGQCFVKNGDQGTSFVASDNTHVAAIRIAAISSTTSSSSSSMGASTTSMSGNSGQSNSMVMPSTSSMASSSPSPSMMACQNNTQVMDTNGKAYNIYCDADTDGSGGGAFAQQGYDTGDFTQCNTACDATATCGAWVWVPYNQPQGGGVCYLKVLPQSYKPGTAGYVAGILISSQPASSTQGSPSTSATQGGASSGGSPGSASTSSNMGMTMQSSTMSSASPTPSVYGPQCPTANGTTYTDVAGKQYVILCDMDTNPGADGQMAEPDFGTCIDACSRTSAPACVGVTYSGNSCYFKNQYQGSVSSPGVEAAVLLSQLNGGSSSSSSAPSSNTMTSGQSSNMMTSMPTSMGVPTSSTHMSSSQSSAEAQGSSAGSSSAMMSQSSSGSMGMPSSQMGGMDVMPGMSTMSSMMTSQMPGSSMGGMSSNGMSMASSMMSNGMTSSSSSMAAMSTNIMNPTTTSMAMSNPQASSSAESESSTSSLSACPTTAGGAQPSNGAQCSDAYGNAFNVTTGRAYTGTITMRAVKPNLDSCLTLCDTTPGCKAVNYIGTECQVLTEVTGSTTTQGAAAAATRPADVSTVYTAPPTTTSMMASSTPASNGASASASTGAGGGGYSTVMQTVTGGQPGQPTPGGSSGGNNPASSMPNNPGSTGMGGTSYQSTKGNVPTSQGMPTMANPSYTLSSGMSNGPSGGGGGPGPVTGGNSGIMSMQSNNPTGGQSQQPSGASNTGGNQGGVSATTIPSTPASIGPVCPDYDDASFADQQGAQYNVQCNVTFFGRVISTTNTTMPTRHKRALDSSASTVKGCMKLCDQNSQCVAMVLDCDGTCTLLSSVDAGQLPPAYYCGFSARKVRAPPSNGGGSSSMGGVSSTGGGAGGGTSMTGAGGGPNVVTVTVCAAKSTWTTTVFSTATVKTCPANAKCTDAAKGKLRRDDVQEYL